MEGLAVLVEAVQHQVREVMQLAVEVEIKEVFPHQKETVAVLVRILWVYPATWLPRMLSRKLREREAAPPNRELFIESWCGMRGIVSLAAALALPATIQSGAPFPHRDLIVFLTFAVIFVTLVGQGLTLAPLIRRLRLASDSSVVDEERRARVDMGRAALVALQRAAEEERADPELVQRVREEFAERVAIASEGVDAQAAALARRLFSFGFSFAFSRGRLCDG